MLSPLITYINQIRPISSDFESIIRRGGHIIDLEKGTVVDAALIGEHVNCFVLDGALRRFSMHRQKDITLDFYLTMDMFDSSVFHKRYIEGCACNIEVVEACRLAIIPFRVIKTLRDQCPETHPLCKDLLIKSFDSVSHQAAVSRVADATDRYMAFLTSFPEFDLMPLKFVASYLGMRIETLSRIRSRLRHPRHKYVKKGN